MLLRGGMCTVRKWDKGKIYFLEKYVTNFYFCRGYQPVVTYLINVRTSGPVMKICCIVSFSYYPFPKSYSHYFLNISPKIVILF